MTTAGLMRPRIAALVGSFCVVALATPNLAAAEMADPKTLAPATTESFENWLQGEMSVSFAKMLANVSPVDTVPGVVVASPQRDNPNYYYHWVRDGALVMDVVGRDLTTLDTQDPTGTSATQLRQMMDTYMRFSRANQLQTQAISGLGEPKFNVDGTPYMLDWGRPQNDAPALRANTLGRYAIEMLRLGQTAYVRENLYDGLQPSQTVIKNDLEYVAHHWMDNSCDIWEEVHGDHFYTRLVQYTAMLNGASLAQQMGDSGAASYYGQQAVAILRTLETFWDPGAGFLHVTLNQTLGVSKMGLDSAVILGILHADLATNLAAGGSTEFTVLDSRVMSTVEHIEEVFAPAYPVNAMTSTVALGTAIGRYPEDTYSGTNGLFLGNPWVLATAGFGEYHYKLAAALATQNSFMIDATNLAFVRGILGTRVGGQPLAAGLMLKRGSAGFTQFVSALITRGDQFLERVRVHENSDGSLSEQINRNTGFMTSARDLSWSYVSLITAGWARAQAE